jgi:hypothetical protein
MTAPTTSATLKIALDQRATSRHDKAPEEAARVRLRLLRELVANRESLVATHLSFPSVCHVAAAGDVFRWVPGPWEY